MSVASETTDVTVSIPSVSSASSLKIMDKEKSDNTWMFQDNVEKKPAWNRLSFVDSGVKPVMGASSWPSLSETTKAAPCSNKSSSDPLKSVACGGSSSSVSFLSQGNSFLAELERKEQTIMDQGFVEQAVVFAISKVTNDTTAQLTGQISSGYPSTYISREFASQSHVGTQSQYQRNSNSNQNVIHPPHQSHGGRSNQEHVNLNFQRNFNGRGGFSQPPRGCTPGFIRPSPPPPPLVPSFYAQHMPVQQPFYPMIFTELAPRMTYYPPRMAFIEPSPVLFPSQEIPLKTKILNQVQYYLSEDNLSNDVHLRKRMTDEGFVHIEFIAGFNKLNALTSNIQFILDSLQGSDVVEVKGYEIRNRHVWRKFVMPQDFRISFHPSLEYAMANDLQNMRLEPKPQEVGSSSSNQRADNNNNSVGSTPCI